MEQAKAKATQVNIGSIQLECLKLPDGQFGITAKQVAFLLKEFYNDFTLERFERLLGKHSKMFSLEVDRGKDSAGEEKILTMQQFEKMVIELAFSDNDEDARVLVKAFVSHSLHQAVSDSFAADKAPSRKFADAIEDYFFRYRITDNKYKKAVHRDVSKAIKVLDGNTEFVEQVERHATLLVDRNDIEPTEALRIAITLNV